MGKDRIKPRSDGCRARRGAIDGRSGYQRLDGVMGMASGNDMKAHGSTYESFIGLLKWAVPVIAIIGIGVVFIIAS